MTGHKDATGVGLTEWISVRWLLKLEVLSDFILAGETTMAEGADFILEAFLEVDGIGLFGDDFSKKIQDEITSEKINQFPTGNVQ